MSRCADNVETVVAECDCVAVVDMLAWGRKVVSAICSDERHGLTSEAFHQWHVVFAHFRAQSERVKYELVTKIMVNVPVRTQKVLRLQAVVFYVVGYGFFLFFVKRAAVYYDTFFCVIAYYVAVFLEHVADKSLYVQHVS